MSLSRRSFLRALPALVAGVALAPAVRLPAPLLPVSWLNMTTAAPLTRAALEETILWLEGNPPPGWPGKSL